MKFGYIGINYKNADLDVRDKISFTDVLKMDYFHGMNVLGVEQGMILSTCNRSEVFFLYGESRQLEEMKRLYAKTFPDADIKNYLCVMSGTEAVEYLFRITAGLESLVLGEDQILGQVKDALDFSRAMGCCGKELSKIVRDAVTCAKKIKTELKISEKPLSVSYVGIRQVEKICGFSGKKVLVIGSGKTSALALRYIYEYGASQVMLCSRTLAHAVDLRTEFPDLEVIRYEERYEVLNTCDIVVSATASPHLVVRSSRVWAEQPITFLDLATPRDIDVELEKKENVTLINLDTLHRIVEKNQKEREELVSVSKDMICEAVKETKDWLLSSRIDPTIASLQQRCSEIVEDSYAYLNRKMELSAREQKIIRKVLDASLHRLLKEPIQELKQLDSREKQKEYEKIVKELFQIS